MLVRNISHRDITVPQQSNKNNQHVIEVATGNCGMSYYADAPSGIQRLQKNIQCQSKHIYSKTQFERLTA